MTNHLTRLSLLVIWGLAACGNAVQQRTLTITNELGAPDGQERYMNYVNGQFPGPALYFDEGDDVEVSPCVLPPMGIFANCHLNISRLLSIMGCKRTRPSIGMACCSRAASGLMVCQDCPRNLLRLGRALSIASKPIRQVHTGTTHTLELNSWTACTDRSSSGVNATPLHRGT